MFLCLSSVEFKLYSYLALLPKEKLIIQRVKVRIATSVSTMPFMSNNLKTHPEVPLEMNAEALLQLTVTGHNSLGTK